MITLPAFYPRHPWTVFLLSQSPDSCFPVPIFPERLFLHPALLTAVFLSPPFPDAFSFVWFSSGSFPVPAFPGRFFFHPVLLRQFLCPRLPQMLFLSSSSPPAVSLSPPFPDAFSFIWFPSCIIGLLLYIIYHVMIFASRLQPHSF